MSSKYPSRTELWELFGQMSSGNYGAFFARVAKDVDWTIMGTSPMSKHFKSLQEFQEATLTRLKPILKEPGLIIKVQNIIGGDTEWAAAEMRADAECVNGMPYNMCYNWVMRFDEKGMIVQVRAYLDTNLLTETLRSHECQSEQALVEKYI